MLPMCSPRPMLMPCSPAMCAAPAMVPMMPMMCPANNFSMFSTSSMMSEFDAQMYGRFRHVEREHPRYRHAPFDWYRPPKQQHDIVHEDAAVVTMDGPVPIGDFYRYYIYGDEYDDYDDDDEYDEYDDDDSVSRSSEDDDLGLPSYEQRSTGYRRNPRRSSDVDDENGLPSRSALSRPTTRASNYSTLNPNRRASVTPSTGRAMGNRRIRPADDDDDAASVNSTYN